MSKLLQNCKGLEVMSFEAGEEIIVEGGINTGVFYILVSGELNVSVKGFTVCVISEPGTVMGEIGVLLDTPRSARVLALTGGEVVLVSDIVAFVENNKAAAWEMARQTGDRLFFMLRMLLKMQLEFVRAAKKFDIDLETIPETEPFFRSWRQAHNEIKNKYPVFFETDREAVDTVSLADGETLFEENEAVEPLYILREGSVTIKNADGSLDLVIDQPGAALNIDTAIVIRRSISTATAKGKAVIEKVNGFQAVLGAESELALDFLRQIAERMVQLNKVFTNLRLLLLELDQAASPQVKRMSEEMLDFLEREEDELASQLEKCGPAPAPLGLASVAA